MIAAEKTEAAVVKDQMATAGVKFKELTDFEGFVYFRLLHQPESVQFATDAEPARIIRENGSYYLVHGLPENLETYQIQSASREVVVDGSSFPLTVLSQGELDMFRQQDYQGLIYLGVLYFLLIAVSTVFTYFQNNTLQYTGQFVIYDIRQKIFQHFASMPISFYRKNPIGRLVTRITHDVESLNQLYSQVIVNLVKEVLILLGIVIIMLYMSVTLTLICFIVIPVIAVITFYFKRVLRNNQRYLRLILSRLNSFLAENLSGMSVIQIFAREEKQLEKFNELNNKHYKAGMRQTVLNSIFNPSIGLFGNLALALLVWYGGQSVMSGAITFGVVYAFTHYVRQFFEPLRGLADRFNQIQAALASAERIFETLETKPSIVNSANPKKLPEKVVGKIEFDHVWFAYQNEEMILKDLSFQIKPGETVGIVGATGAGKSSIIQLINRFYDIQKGRILLDGINIKEIDIADLRKRIGIIQQDAFVFSGTVYDNIRLNNHHVKNEEIVEAAKSVNIDTFFQMLPDGYETMLGEEGVVLSTGQKQLLSFLRAMIANNDVLILDEATANIDTETELAVQHTLQQFSKNRTTIIIAHRLSTIQHADKILVLDKGKILEMGHHEELLIKQGAYYQLCVNQNKGKRKVPERG